MAYDHAALRYGQNVDAQGRQTPYRAVLHASKLAAQWAAFFDALRVEYVYRPSAYHLADGISFTPDFWLPRLGAWLIVRPADSVIRNADRWKIELFAREQPACRVWVASGEPRAGEWHIEQLGGSVRPIARGLLLADADLPAERVWICGANDDSERLIFDPVDVAGNTSDMHAGRPADPNGDPVMRIAYGHVERLESGEAVPIGALARQLSRETLRPAA